MLYNQKKSPGKATILRENKEIKTFIKEWQKKNIYKSKENLKKHNENFRNDFKKFLSAQKFSEYTKTFFIS
ncbi:hypothetical protein [Polaribacter sp.]|uniref:hypothetical protein n=1 Tax=Polaribacter sp. TaxID=1920175 RepID=UPI003F6D6530